MTSKRGKLAWSIANAIGHVPPERPKRSLFDSRNRDDVQYYTVPELKQQTKRIHKVLADNPRFTPYTERLRSLLTEITQELSK